MKVAGFIACYQTNRPLGANPVTFFCLLTLFLHARVAVSRQTGAARNPNVRRMAADYDHLHGMCTSALA